MQIKIGCFVFLEFNFQVIGAIIAARQDYPNEGTILWTGGIQSADWFEAGHLSGLEF